jgi:hypothetical protein
MLMVHDVCRVSDGCCETSSDISERSKSTIVAEVAFSATHRVHRSIYFVAPSLMRAISSRHRSRANARDYFHRDIYADPRNADRLETCSPLERVLSPSTRSQRLRAVLTTRDRASRARSLIVAERRSAYWRSKMGLDRSECIARYLDWSSINLQPAVRYPDWSSIDLQPAVRRLDWSSIDQAFNLQSAE